MYYQFNSIANNVANTSTTATSNQKSSNVATAIPPTAPSTTIVSTNVPISATPINTIACLYKDDNEETVAHQHLLMYNNGEAVIFMCDGLNVFLECIYLMPQQKFHHSIHLSFHWWNLHPLQQIIRQ